MRGLFFLFVVRFCSKLLSDMHVFKNLSSLTRLIVDHLALTEIRKYWAGLILIQVFLLTSALLRCESLMFLKRNTPLLADCL